MKPLLASKPAMWRSLLFGPTLLGLLIVVFLVLGFATDQFLVSLIASAAVALAGTVALLGWPEVKRKDGKPLVDPRWKPYLFFLLAPALGVFFYMLFGAVLTQLALPAQLLAYASLGLSVVAACALAYWLVGFPHVIRGARTAYATVPPERRPFLFFPLFVVIFLVVFLGLGVTTTQAMGKLGDSQLLLNIQVLVLLPVSLLVAGVGAYLLVGIPKPQRSPTQYLPKVTGKHRPWVFAATFLLLGIPLTLLIGMLLTWVAGRVAAFPAGLILPLALLLGYMLSLGIAALGWGTPRKWAQYDDYTPGIPPRARVPLYVASGVAVWLGVTLIFGLAGADIFWGLLTGAILGILVGLQLAGIMGLVAQRRRERTIVPDMPDRLKPLIFFPAWLVMSALLFTVLTYTLPDIVHWNLLASLVISLAILLFLLEQPLLLDLVADRQREREKRKAWEQRRQERLARELSGESAGEQQPR